MAGWRWLILGAALAASARAQSWTVETVALMPPPSGSYVPFFNGVAADRSGNIFAAGSSRAVYKVSPQGVVTVFAGDESDPGAIDGVGRAARFSNPEGIVIDAAQNIYVSDSAYATIRKITPEGVVSTFAGKAMVSGTTDGPGSTARFNSPSAMAIDEAGNIYVVDLPQRIRKISPAGVVSTFAVASELARNSGEVPWSFDYDILAVDKAGNVYAASVPGVIRKISPAGLVTVVAGFEGQWGCVDGTGSAARFGDLGGLAVDAEGRIIVADRTNHLLREISTAGVVTTVAGQPGWTRDSEPPPPGPTAGPETAFRTIQRLALAPDGSVLIPDDRVLRRARRVAAPQRPIVLRPSFTWDSSVIDLAVGTPFSFTAVASGTPPLSYQWIKDSAVIPGATQATLTLASAKESDQGSYTVQVSNSAGIVGAPMSFLLRVYTPTIAGFTKRRETPGGSFLWCLASGGGQLVAVGTQGRILTSGDGRVWTVRPSGTSEWLVGAAYGAGKYVAVGDHGTILVSPDGAHWAPAPRSGTTQRLNNVIYAAGKFVAVGEFGTIVSSTDGLQWTLRPSAGTSVWLRGLTYKPLGPVPAPSANPNTIIYYSDGGGRFYAAGQGGMVLSSLDGEIWQRSYIASDRLDIEALAEGPTGIGQNGFVLGQRLRTTTQMSSGKNVMDPTDGNVVTYYTTEPEWYSVKTNIGARFRGLSRGAGALFATGENGLIVAAPGVEGPWANISTGTTANLVSGVFHGNTLYVVGENETILASDPLYTSRMINISTLGAVSPGNAMFSGFVVGGDQPKQVLVRAVGAGLGRFGVTGTISNPQLTVYDSAHRALAYNSGWNQGRGPGEIEALVDAAKRVGAFPLSPGDWDSALLLTLAPGAYSAEIAAAGVERGRVLVEVYDADAISNESSRAINISTRGSVGGDAGPLTAGFVIGGTASRRVLIRGVGPSLAAFGVPNVLAQPTLRLVDAKGATLKTAAAWSAATDQDDLRNAAAIAGAFAFTEGSADSALIVSLVPGAYTVVVSGAVGPVSAPGAAGAALVEVYDLP